MSFVKYYKKILN